MIVVIDYNIGNVKSVCNVLRHIGCDVELSRDADVISKADGLVLPGVAAFGFAMAELSKTADVIKEVVEVGKPILGICVGFQLLFESSVEHGENEGLGLIKGKVAKIPAGRTIPHMGWNLVKHSSDMELFNGMGQEDYFYFAHSYYAQISDNQAKVAYTDYGFEIPASVQKGNIFGVQFHPEKSSKEGLAVLKNFEKICKGGC